MSTTPLHRWIDIHCHLDKLDISVDDALASAKAVGVQKVLTIGTCFDDLDFVIDSCKKYPGVVYGTLGVHPHDAKDWTPNVLEKIRSHVNSNGIVAIGEIGLDYYYQHSDREVQKQAFEQQLELAAQSQLPVEIHTRDAEEDTAAILRNFRGRVKGVIHCFTSSRQFAEIALDLGYNISASGIVTFKNAQDLRDTISFVPLDRLHVETDAPFLAPVPHRGKKNIPSYVSDTAAFVANLKGVPLNQFSDQMWKNAETLFTRLKDN